VVLSAQRKVRRGASSMGTEIAAVEETFKRLQSHKGVLGVLVLNADGISIRSTFDNDTTVQYAALVSQFTVKARGAVRQLDPDNELRFLRIRSKKHEIMIAPEFEKSREYYLVVVQDPAAE
jgi:dynein light chain roadblock-type